MPRRRLIPVLLLVLCVSCDESPSDDCLDATAAELRRLQSIRDGAPSVACQPFFGEPEYDMICGIRRADSIVRICGGDLSLCTQSQIAEANEQWELSMELLATCIEQR